MPSGKELRCAAEDGQGILPTLGANVLKMDCIAPRHTHRRESATANLKHGCCGKRSSTRGRRCGCGLALVAAQNFQVVTGLGMVRIKPEDVVQDPLRRRIVAAFLQQGVAQHHPWPEQVRCAGDRLCE